MRTHIVLLSLAALCLTLNSSVLATDRLVPSQYSTQEVFPISLNYDAEAYAYAWAEVIGQCESDTIEDFSNNSKAMAQAHAHLEYFEEYPVMCMVLGIADSYMDVSGEVVYGSDMVSLVSWFNGSGSWSYDDTCSGSDSGPGGEGSGYSSLTGLIEIGIFEGHPLGSPGLKLKVDAEVTGDASDAWSNWDWWLKIWDDDPDYPIALLSDSNMSECFAVLAGQIFNFEFYHEAEKVYWPEAGLESTVVIDLYLLPLADLDQDRDVDFIDYAILTSRWKATPGIPPADIAPPGGDDIVDGKDLATLVEYWLWGK